MRRRAKRDILRHIIGDHEVSPMGCAPIITTEGRERILVTSCRSILEYSCECVLLELGCMNVRVTGEHLTLKTYFGDRITVSGIISKLEFEVS